MKKGFTLIELLVVVAIIGLLSSIVTVSLSSARAKGRDAKRMRDIEELRTAIEIYINDYGSAPEVGGGYDNNPVVWGALAAELVPNYIPTLPTDPCGNSCDDLGNSLYYHYGYSSPSLSNPAFGNNYGLYSQLEKGGYFIIGDTSGVSF